ncbi:hypothetical protein TNCV_1871581 [Trichonephila clavipes]|nr:hypothetical protein TNCV_1871581 [Trichonephila clavipes]
MICANASIMVVYDHPPQDNEKPQSLRRNYLPHHYRSPSMFHGLNQAVNMKCFCRCLPDEHKSSGLE